MNLTEKIGLNIKRARVAKKISQEQLAYLTNLHQSQIYRFENGKQPISTLHLENISKVLEIPAIEFFKTDTSLKEVSGTHELLEIVYRMPEAQKEELVKILREIKGYDFTLLRKAVELIRDIKEG